jgi:hypothetical protein
MTDLRAGLLRAGHTLEELDLLDAPAALGAIDRLPALELRFVIFRAWLDAHPEQATAAGWEASVRAHDAPAGDPQDIAY